MPFSCHPHTTALNPQYGLPNFLQHQPVFAIPYHAMDGNSFGQTDAQFISIGLAQWDNNEVAVKTMRHTGGQWSRQSEELPLHRVIDMTLFLAKVVFDENAGRTFLPGGTMHNQASTDLTVEIEPIAATQTSQYRNAIAAEQALLRDRLNSLLNVLSDLKNRGKI